jgi:hypothetical protein
MKKVKAGLRLFAVVLFVLLAAFGAGMMGGIFNNRQQYQDNEIKIEMVDKKEYEESENESKDQKQ